MNGGSHCLKCTSETSGQSEKSDIGTSLVAQSLRIRLPMQGTWVWSLVWEDPTCCGATKPMCHNYWACAPRLLKPARSRACVLQLLSPHAATTEACAPRAHASQQEKPPQWEACALQQGVASSRCNKDLTQPKIKKKKRKKKKSQTLTNNYKCVQYNDGEMQVLTGAYNKGT